MNLTQYFAALGSMALSVRAGGVNVAQCNAGSALWVNPSLCTDTATEISQCSSSSRILSAPNYEMNDVSWSKQEEETKHTNSLPTTTDGVAAQCNGRSALWLSPSLCAETSTDLSKCTGSNVLSPTSSFEMHDTACVQDEKQVKSMLTNFMTWASLTRDVEMLKGQELCEASNENIVMPWDVQMCADDFKLVHRTQPMLDHGGYKFDQRQIPAMSGKNTIAGGGTDTNSRFGLPREKVRKFTSLLNPQHIHSWRNVPAESYV
mmetsp:Transcript_19286/g.29266  ORF Transcript_19286/g.29266 Transcript_19286/m.29266 type:complete len:262 (-) Transcript_19286:492-1277(-)